MPGSIIAERFGGKHILGFGMLTTALFTIITPATISWGDSTALIGLRILMGLCEGMAQPALAVLMAQWIPANERSRISSFVNMGSIFGMVLVSLSLGPVMRVMDWDGVYYLFGGIGVLWYLLWSVLCYNNSREHPFISEAEAKKLNDKLREHTHANAPPVPWSHLLTSAPFWALVIISIGRDWSFYTILSDIPKYMMNVLKFSVDEVGLVFLIINVAVLIGTAIFSWLSDWLIEKKYMSRTNVRKLMSVFGVSVHAVFSVIASYVGCNKIQYSAVLICCFLTSSAGFPGIKANVLDLSPNYAGTVMAVSHGLAGDVQKISSSFILILVNVNKFLLWILFYRIVRIWCTIRSWNSRTKSNFE